MPKLRGINHQRAIEALQKAGFHIAIARANTFSCRKAPCVFVVPRNNPVNAYTMVAIVRDAGLTIEEFKELL